MDRYSRNERLYHFLLGMGLVVTPNCSEDDPSKIESLWVSASLPSGTAEDAAHIAQDAAETGVGEVVEGAQVGEVVCPPRLHGTG